MSDQDVLHCIEVMEDRLFNHPDTVDADTVAAWNQEFGLCVDSAERGPQWQSIVDRAHQLSQRIVPLVSALNEQKEKLKAEMVDQVKGERALKAYRP